jgi:hypothetical protein
MTLTASYFMSNLQANKEEVNCSIENSNSIQPDDQFVSQKNFNKQDKDKLNFTSSSPSFASTNYRFNQTPGNPCQMDIKQDMKNSLSCSLKNENHSMNQIFKSLFGADISNWPYSEDSLKSALKLRNSQEITKQEFYKVEQMNRIIEILKLAVVAKIPGQLIPSLLNNDNNNNNNSTKTLEFPDALKSQNSLQSPPPSSTFSPSNSPSPNKTNHHHVRNRTISNLSDLHSDSNYKSSSNIQAFSKLDSTDSATVNNRMKNFKFGLDSSNKITHNLRPNSIQKKRTLLSPKHQLSPSRIGAHAISSLNRHSNSKKSINIMNFRHGTNHKRTLSLPVTVSIPETEQMNFHDPIKPSKEIIIPELNYNYKTTITETNTIFEYESNNDDIDVDKLLNGSSSSSSSSSSSTTTTKPNGYTNCKKLGGSPLKEMVTLTENLENTTILTSNENEPFMNTSNANISALNSPSPKETVVVEPKTP